MPSDRSLRLLAPAKINLHLRIGPPGADGFHPLLSWMVRLGLCDTLTLSPGDVVASGPTPAVMQLECDDPAVPCDASNLVVRAAQVLMEVLAGEATREGGDALNRGDGTRELCRVSAALQKRIPMGAGLGGGSSDGASALRGLNRLWRAGWGRAALAAISLRLGSDLPFFFGPSSVCTGRGQFVRPTPPPKSRWAMLVLPAIHMPTPVVYRQFDQMGLGDEPRLREEPDWSQWALLPVQELLPLLHNDLESPAFFLCPELGHLRLEIENLLGRPVRMSGSGSSLFTLYDTQDAATAAAGQVADRFSRRSQAVEIAPDLPDDLMNADGTV